jgi:hypothetical protein
LSEAQARPSPADAPTVWGILWVIGIVLLGMSLFVYGLAIRPPERSALTVTEQVGPISYTTPLVTVSG